jgi:hypothetical protein
MFFITSREDQKQTGPVQRKNPVKRKRKHFQNRDFKNEFCEVIRNHGFGNAFKEKEIIEKKK